MCSATRSAGEGWRDHACPKPPPCTVPPSPPPSLSHLHPGGVTPLSLGPPSVLSLPSLAPSPSLLLCHPCHIPGALTVRTPRRMGSAAAPPRPLPPPLPPPPLSPAWVTTTMATTTFSGAVVWPPSPRRRNWLRAASRTLARCSPRACWPWWRPTVAVMISEQRQPCSSRRAEVEAETRSVSPRIFGQQWLD